MSAIRLRLFVLVFINFFFFRSAVWLNLLISLFKLLFFFDIRFILIKKKQLLESATDNYLEKIFRLFLRVSYYFSDGKNLFLSIIIFCLKFFKIFVYNVLFRWTGLTIMCDLLQMEILHTTKRKSTSTRL